MPASRASRRRTIAESGDASSLSQPTSPPASPHRAGHYSGLHAEDQPFQSSFYVRIQRPSGPEPEPFETDASTLLDLEEDEPSRTPSYPARPPLSAEYTDEEENAPDFSALADFPTLYTRRSADTPLPETPLPVTRRGPITAPRLLRLLITGSLICFLLATGLLAFLLVGRDQSRAQTGAPRLLALPGELRVGDVLQLAGSGFESHHAVLLVHDASVKLLDAQGRQLVPTTDAQGAFLVHIPIDAAWSLGVHSLQANEGTIKTSTSLTIEAAVAGPPRLQLGSSHLDLGGGNPGVSSHENITLTNAGGGRVSWSAQSNAAWLTLSPASGSFAGNALVVLTVDRANLAPLAYLGQIVFTQTGGSAQTLYVSMTVNTTAANLVLSTASLAFSGPTAQSPAGQTIVIQNNGGQTLNWTVGTSTEDGGNWLNITPASGRLDADTSAILTVTVTTQNMTLGTYHGVLSFSYADGPAQQVAVTLTVTPPPQPAMRLSTGTLNFASKQGSDPPPQTFAITNTGNAPLNWLIRADSAGLIYLAISPISGSIPPGQSANVSIAPLLGSANGTISSTLTVMDSDPGTSVHSQQVNVSIAITDEPVITVVTNRLEFDHGSGNQDSTNMLIFANTGSLPLDWTLVESTQVPWLSFDTTSGTLAVSNSIAIHVRCVSSQMPPGTYTVTLTLKDSDAGSVVAARTITVTLVISA